MCPFSANEFPSSFESIVRKILRLLYHVVAHIYHSHFRDVAELGLHAHLNCVFAHLTLLNQRFNLIDPKETEILGDLEAALLGKLSAAGWFCRRRRRRSPRYWSRLRNNNRREGRIRDWIVRLRVTEIIVRQSIESRVSGTWLSHSTRLSLSRTNDSRSIYNEIICTRAWEETRD